MAEPLVAPVADDPDRWRRRAISISGVLLASWALAAAALPLLLATLLLELVRPRRLAATRALLMFGAFLGCEVLGLLGAGWIALTTSGEALVEASYTLQRRWNSALSGALSALFNLTWDVQGLEVCRPGPTLLLVRHASTADTILPVALLSAGLGLKLRYVLKSELLWDPCIDVIGQRVPNVFVRRGDAGEVDRVRALAKGLGVDETLVLYPEGTRFSPSRQAARLAELQSQPEDIQSLARALQVTLAPKPGGVLAILDAEPTLDVVFCAHTGLEGARTLADLVRGELVDKVVKVRFERVSAADIPTDPAARYRWLLTRWGAIDAWIRAQSTGASVIVSGDPQSP
ncbi:MAG: hypothetical protein RIT28_1404 [Pseudomonadota bacterium]|jgi:1-acyl-sn-glycerol-3-phosphate acyltransferase